MNYNATPNHRQYLLALAKMGEERRLLKALELSSTTKELFLSGLYKKFPDKTEQKSKKYICND